MRTRLTLAALAAASAAHAAPAPKAAPPPLTGSTVREVKARLGEPAVASQEGKGALWTYRFESCALMVFFKDEGRGLRVTGISAGARTRGAAPPDPEACLGEGK